METTSTVLGAVLAAALVVACGSDDAQFDPVTPQNPAPDPRPRLGVTAAQGGGFDHGTIDLIADACCDREAQCNEIGPGRKYPSRARCDEQNGVTTSTELNAVSCPRGVDHDTVSRCVTAINREPCSSSLETLGRIADCRAYALCMK